MTPISASCGRELLIGDEPRRERPDGDARHQVAHERRQMQTGRRCSHRRAAKARPMATVAISAG